VVAVSHVSVDPAMRGWMNAARSYIAPVELAAARCPSTTRGKLILASGNG
jgi:NADPH-dependent curcumin reductase CurA